MEPWNRIHDPLLSCWYHVYGSVGLYWILPVWMAMYLEGGWSVVEAPIYHVMAPLSPSVQGFPGDASLRSDGYRWRNGFNSSRCIDSSCRTNATPSRQTMACCFGIQVHSNNCTPKKKKAAAMPFTLS